MTTLLAPFEVLVDDVDADEERWLAERRIGGTAAGALLGVSKYATPETLYRELTGEYRREVGTAAEAGRRLEPVVREWTADLLGVEIDPWKQLLRSREWPFLTVSPDAKVAFEDVGVELKAPGLRQADEWADGAVPLAYQAQCQHAMAVTGYRSWIIGALIGGQEPVVHVIERDDFVVDAIVAAAADLWDRVQRRDPPEPDWSHPATTEALKALYGDSEPDTTVEVDPNLVLPLLEQRRQLKWSAKGVAADLDGVENQLRALLGHHEIATVNGQPVFTWKTITSHRLDTKALKKAHPDVHAEFAKESNSRRLWVPGE